MYFLYFACEGFFFSFVFFHFSSQHTQQYESHIYINDFIAHHSQPHLPLTHYCLLPWFDVIRYAETSGSISCLLACSRSAMML